MKLRASKPFKVKLKSQSGSVRVRWQVKLWTQDDHTNKMRVVAQKTFESRAAAVDATRELVANYEKTDGKIALGERMTFNDLAAQAKKTIYKPAVILAGRKTDGVKRYKSVHGQLDILARYFGPMRIGNIVDEDLRAYQKWRYDLGSLRGKTKGVPVSLTVINRELAVMRRVMKYAFAKGWVTRDVFAGTKVIDAGAEIARSRILSDAEESTLLAFSRDGASPYLTSIILFALDSAMRKTEILKLSWKDLDLEKGEANILSEHTKTQETRTAPLSERLIDELQKLPTYRKAGRIFPITEFKRSWNTTKKLAGLDDVRFHDLRRTAVTRLQLEGVPLAIAAKIAGHARHETTARIYTATDSAIVQSVRELINAGNITRAAAQVQPAEDAGEFVN